MSAGLVLSLFPGIGLLDRAFELEGFCVVRGPDLLWGGDIKTFHPPAGVFDGVIGGPPCHLWAATASFPRSVTPTNLIPEFERCLTEALPTWFVMENVVKAPLPELAGYHISDVLVRDVWVGGATKRLRRFTFGSLDERSFSVEQLALHDPEPRHTVTSGGTQYRRDGTPYRDRNGNMRNYGAKTSWGFEQGKRLQGLPDDFDLPPFLVCAKVEAIGAGVPLPMGRAVARAVKSALKLGAA